MSVCETMSLLGDQLNAISSPDPWLNCMSYDCRYSDYTRTESGLQYQDLREGTGKSAKAGAQVTIDWDGYTIGDTVHLLLPA